MIGVDELMEWLRAEPEDVDSVRAMERAAVAYINRPGERYFGPTASIVDLIVWRGGVAQLSNDPNGTVVLEEWSGTVWMVVAASEFFMDGRLLYLHPTRAHTVSDPVHLRATYPGGWGTPLVTDTDIWAAPEDIKQAVRMLVADWFEHPEGERNTSAEVAATVEAILRKYQ